MAPKGRKGGRLDDPTPAAPRRGATTNSPPPPAVSPPPRPPPLVRAPPPCPPPSAPWFPQSAFGPQGSPSSSANPWGYVNLLQQPHFPTPSQPLGENFHFVGSTNNFSPPCPATTPVSNGIKTPNMSINIDDDDNAEANKTVKKRYWSHKEEVALASAWLNTSKDPIHGNDKKGESFWKQITEEYNRNMADRRRDINQLKVHWSRLGKTINEFNGYWISVSRMNKSGYSDDQLMDEAQQMYEKKNGKPFALVHWWRILKNEPKWCTHVEQLEKEKNKTIHVDISDDKEERPMGREAAKEQRKGKRKADQMMDGIVILGENMNKIVEVSEERRKEREKVTQDQLEISRAALEVAKQQKEVAKQQKEAKFLEAYTALLVQDITNMSEEAKASREKTLIIMQKKLAANCGEI